MSKIEKILENKKSEIDKLEIPEELESRLRNKLKDQPSEKKIKISWKIKIAVIFISAILATYNIDTLAFYGKKLVGYNNIMDNNLKQLNELNKGQIIGKNYTFKNGTTINLDGVMLDDNQLLAFYTIQYPNEKIDESNSSLTMFMKGSLGQYYMHRGQGDISEEQNKSKWIASFEVPNFFEKSLICNFSLLSEGKQETGSIEFTLDRNKAMGRIFRKPLNKSLKLEDTKIHFESISASPTTTIIKGSLQNILELAMAQINNTRFRPKSLDIKLIANGKELYEKSSGLSTDMKGIKFYKEYEALPNDLKTLQLNFISFTADYDVNKKIKLKKYENNKSINVLNQNIKINTIYESKGETYITITTKEDVILSRVYLILDGEKIELKETISDEYSKFSNGIINHTRTLRFSGTGDDLKLDIKRIKYNKIYDHIIDIPIT